MKGFHHAIALLVSAILISASTTVFAEDDEMQPSSQSGEEKNGTKLVNEAVSLFQIGAYEKAMALFLEAYEIMGEPNILFNIARCHQELGEKEKAIDYYHRFLEHPKTLEEYKPAAQRRLKEMETESVSSFEDHGQSEDTASSVETPNASSSTHNEDRLTPPLPHKPRISRIPEWTLISAGAVLTVAGAALGGAALATHKKFESSDDREDKKDYERTGKTLALTSDITLGVGIVSLATGLILFFVRGRKDAKEPQTTAFIPSANKNSFGLSWMAHF